MQLTSVRLHRTGRSGCGNLELIARLGRQGIFSRRLLGNLPRKGLIDTALYDDLGKLIQFKRGIVAQLLAFARDIRPFRLRLGTDGHILAGGHRHGASNQTMWYVILGVDGAIGGGLLLALGGRR